MSNRKKILIVERDDFLREIVGNLLHKNGLYILNGFCIQDGIENAQNQHINTVLLGTSCRDYKGKQSLDYIKKHLTVDAFFILNEGSDDLDFVSAENQMKMSELSIEALVNTFS